MTNTVYKTLVSVVLALSVAVTPAQACSWAVFANQGAAVVARTMDWYCDDSAVVKGHGRGAAVKAAQTQNALEYKAKYATLQVHSFGDLTVTEAMNEKGLQGSSLYLEGSRLPDAKAGLPDVDPALFISYVVSNFATVQEVVDNMSRINLVSISFSLPREDGKSMDFTGPDFPLHFAFADAGGDKVIIELLKGEAKIYHGKEHNALTNEPPYEAHLGFDEFGPPPGGTIGTMDRRGRAKNYLRDMLDRDVASQERALAAMRGLQASVWAGTEELDRADNAVYPTIWSVLADQKAQKYYLSRYNTWCAEQYDFTMFDVTKPEVVTLEAANCPYPKMNIEGAK